MAIIARRKDGSVGLVICGQLVHVSDNIETTEDEVYAFRDKQTGRLLTRLEAIEFLEEEAKRCLL